MVTLKSENTGYLDLLVFLIRTIFSLLHFLILKFSNLPLQVEVDRCVPKSKFRIIENFTDIVCKYKPQLLQIITWFIAFLTIYLDINLLNADSQSLDIL